MKLCNKCYNFNFHIVNFPFLSSSIPWPFIWCLHFIFSCTYYDDFGYCHKVLVDRLLSQGFKVNRLENSFQTFYGRYPHVAVKYQKSFLFLIQQTYAVKALTTFLIYMICHLECHFNTIVAVCEGVSCMRQTMLTQSKASGCAIGWSDFSQ